MLNWYHFVLLCRILALFLGFSLLSLFYLVTMLFGVETDIIVAKHVSQSNLFTSDHLKLADA